MIRKVVLPAAGHGTRLRPLTRFIPKEMLPVGDRLVIEHVLAECRAAGLDCILAVVSRSKLALVEAMETIAADEAGDEIYPQICIVNQRVQGGLGHAVLHAEAFAGSDPFAVALADTIIEDLRRARLFHGASCNERAHVFDAMRSVAKTERLRTRKRERAKIRKKPFRAFALSRFRGLDPVAFSRQKEEPLLARLIAAHEAHGAAATVAVEEVPRERLSRYGVVRPDPGALPPGEEPFRIVDLVEKPAPEAAPSNLAIAARYVFAPAIFDALRALLPKAGAGRELQLTDAIATLARAGHTVLGVRLAPHERRRDIGTLASYAEAFGEYSPCKP